MQLDDDARVRQNAAHRVCLYRAKPITAPLGKLNHIEMMPRVKLFDRTSNMHAVPVDPACETTTYLILRRTSELRQMPERDALHVPNLTASTELLRVFDFRAIKNVDLPTGVRKRLSQQPIMRANS